MNRAELQRNASTLLVAPHGKGYDFFDDLQLVNESLQESGLTEKQPEVLKALSLVQRVAPLDSFIFPIIRKLYRSGFDELDQAELGAIRRLAVAVASDPLLGNGVRAYSTEEALKVISPKVVAAVGLIYSAVGRMTGKGNERYWKDLVSESLQRAEIGLLLSQQRGEGYDRGLLTGFFGKMGAAFQLVAGDAKSAAIVQEQLAAGLSWEEIGQSNYGSPPSIVSQVTLLSGGVPSRDVKAIFGDSAFSQEIQSFFDDPNAASGDEEIRKVLQSGCSWGWINPQA